MVPNFRGQSTLYSRGACLVNRPVGLWSGICWGVCLPRVSLRKYAPPLASIADLLLDPFSDCKIIPHELQVVCPQKHGCSSRGVGFLLQIARKESCVVSGPAHPNKAPCRPSRFGWNAQPRFFFLPGVLRHLRQRCLCCDCKLHAIHTSKYV